MKMTFDDIEKTLPNGFHDAFIQNININYIKRELIFDLDVCTGDPSSDDEKLRERYRKGQLTLNNLLYCIIEPPDPNYSYQEAKPLWIEMGNLSSLKKFPLKPILKSIPNNAFVRWIFVRDWNSFIYVSAEEANFKWIE